MVFDAEYFRTMCDGDRAFEREVLESFLDSSASLITRMTTALEARDPSGILEAAHGLKGSSRSIGAPALGDSCAVLESVAASGNLTGAPSAVNQVRGDYERLVEALVAHRDGEDAAA